MKTVILVPFGLGIAHTGRLIMIARELRMRGVKCIFAAGSDAIGLLTREQMPFTEIPEFPKTTYNRRMKNNNPFVYSRQIIENFIRAELEAYRKTGPDIVVYDARFTARISAEIAGIPTVSVANANFTPSYDFARAKLSMNTLLSKFLPERILGVLEGKYGQEFLSRLWPAFVQSILLVEMIRMSPSLFKLGYKIKTDPYQLLSGNLALLTDVSEYRPVKELPPNAVMTGPIFWDGGSGLPSWSRQISRTDDIIYVSAGGTGDKMLFIKILKYLKVLPYTVVATTGNTFRVESDGRNGNTFVTDYIPGSFILPRTKLAIFPGGNATCYQILSYGIPQIVTPFHLDQEDNANQLERLGTGRKMNPHMGFTREKFMESVNEILTNSYYRKNALKMQKVLSRYEGARKAAEEICRYQG